MTTDAPICLAYAQLILAGRVGTSDLLERVLAALEGSGALVPRRWGPAAHNRAPYFRDEVVKHVRTADEGEGIFFLRSHDPLAYLAHVYAAPDQGPVSTLDVQSKADYTVEQAETFFGAVTQVAEAVDVEFGTIDVRFADQDPETFMRKGVHAHPLGPYLKQGPDVILPRMFFGPRIVELLQGPTVLEQSGAVVTPLGTTGGLIVDLVESPWTATPEALKAAQISVERHLLLSGLFARKAGDWGTIAGPRWTPVT